MWYKGSANIRVEFYEVSTLLKDKKIGTDEKTAENVTQEGLGPKSFNIYGFLSDEGLQLSLTNRYQNALDLAGGFLSQIGDLIAGVRAGIGWASGNETSTYIQSAGKNTSIFLNAPYYWQGTDPIRFSLNLYAIADREDQIIHDYQRVLEILSPASKNGGTETAALTQGPGVAKVHYFPGADGEGQGQIILGPCLCDRVDMKVAAPYSAAYQPLLGIYTFSFLVSRIKDRAQISQIFDNKYPFAGTAAQTLADQAARDAAGKVKLEQTETQWAEAEHARNVAGVQSKLARIRKENAGKAGYDKYGNPLSEI